jgi:hypothetical protein
MQAQQKRQLVGSSSAKSGPRKAQSSASGAQKKAPGEADASHNPAPAEVSGLVVGEPPGESEEL